MKEIFKTILAGVLAGAALFFMPIILIKILVVLVLFKFAFRLLGFGRGHHYWSHKYHHMTDEQKEAFRKKWGEKGCCSSHHTENSHNPNPETV